MQSFNVGKQHVIIRARAGDTNGASSVLEMHHPPESGPPLHVHQFEEEGFYILEGSYRFTLFAPEKQVKEVGPGDFVMAVRGVPHSFRSLGPGMGRMLVYFTPGGAEGYFEESSRISTVDPDRAARRQQLEQKFGITLVSRKPALSEVPANTPDLDFSLVPDLSQNLPQTDLLKEVAAELFASDEVRAIWLGGSLARGEGDAFSDIDLRLFVTDESFSEIELPAAAAILRRDAVVHLPMNFGTGILHHLMLSSGTILDLFVQKATAEPSSEARLILGVKDAALAAKLMDGADPPPPAFAPARIGTVERLLLTFWISEQKHLKVIYRGLGLVAWQGEHFIRQEVLKLFFIFATGSDCGNSIGSIHVMSPVARAIQDAFGDEALALLGTPRRTIPELMENAEMLQDKVASLGRTLCDRHGATYPEGAEATVLKSWQAFRALDMRTPDMKGQS